MNQTTSCPFIAWIWGKPAGWVAREESLECQRGSCWSIKATSKRIKKKHNLIETRASNTIVTKNSLLSWGRKLQRRRRRTLQRDSLFFIIIIHHPILAMKGPSDEREKGWNLTEGKQSRIWYCLLHLLLASTLAIIIQRRRLKNSQAFLWTKSAKKLHWIMLEWMKWACKKAYST